MAGGDAGKTAANNPKQSQQKQTLTSKSGKQIEDEILNIDTKFDIY
jgi:hypothetical protein